MTEAPVQLIGAVPAWMQLGPVVSMDGVPAREVLGDWSHLPEWNRPPRYVIDGVVPVRTPLDFDRSPDRAPIPQRLPGKSIGDLKGIHSGKVAILFNGPSLADHDLHRIKVPIIGMNRTHPGNPKYDGPDPDYLCVVDAVWCANADVQRHPRVIDGGVNRKAIGYRATRCSRASPFSFDLLRDGYVPMVPCTTGSLALQVAAYMGFTDLYCLGFDLGGGHFDGSVGSNHFSLALIYHTRQVPVLRQAGIRVTVCGSPKSRAPFEHSTFEELCS